MEVIFRLLTDYTPHTGRLARLDFFVPKTDTQKHIDFACEETKLLHLSSVSSHTTIAVESHTLIHCLEQFLAALKDETKEKKDGKH